MSKPYISYIDPATMQDAAYALVRAGITRVGGTPPQMTKWLGPGRTFCAHAPGAMEPLQSALKYFRSEFEAGIRKVTETVSQEAA